MPTMPGTGDATARGIDEQFLDLICRDADLLAAEFDAIIAAEWPTPPANGAGRRAARGYPVRRAAGRAADPIRGPVARPRHPGIGGWARQRSPPPGRPYDARQEGR